MAITIKRWVADRIVNDPTPHATPEAAANVVVAEMTAGLIQNAEIWNDGDEGSRLIGTFDADRNLILETDGRTIVYTPDAAL